jgi:hypothetical protein
LRESLGIDRLLDVVVEAGCQCGLLVPGHRLCSESDSRDHGGPRILLEGGGVWER